MARMTVERASPVWLGISLVAVAGFLVWLFMATRSLETAVTPVLADGEGGGKTYAPLSLVELASNAGGVVGRNVELEPAPVVESLGRGVFALQADAGVTYPVLLARDLIARDTRVYGGDRVRLYGHIFTLNDSIRGEWVAQTAVDADKEARLPRTASFLLADSVVFVP